MKLLYKLFRDKMLNPIAYAAIWILLAVLFVFVFTSCNQFQVEPMQMYNIDKGSHYSNYYNLRNKKKSTEKKIAPIIIRGNRLEFTYRFVEDNKYDISEIGRDINKLYGITSTKIHENSARIGWRYIGNDNFEVFAYWYKNGARGFKSLLVVKTNIEVYYIIDVSGNQYTFGANNNWFHVYGTKNILAARSFPYFGGNLPAPHRMSFIITEH